MDAGIVSVWAGAPALPVRRLLIAGETGLLLGVACGPGPAPAPRPPAPTARPSAAPQQSMDAWRARGATEIPPDAIRHVTMDGIQVVNQATGAVSDADAKAWAEALMRSSNYDDWALNRMQEGFYLGSGLSAAPQTAFSYELSRIQQARLAGDRIEATCQGSGQVATAHRYTNYSSSQSSDGAFQVTLTESYSAHVVEYWYDTQPEAMDLGDGGIPPFDVVAGPMPMAVIQEEGVPVVP